MNRTVRYWIRIRRSFFSRESLERNRNRIIFLICVFIAFILWFLNALSKDYTTQIVYPVKYTELPKHKFLSNTPPQRLLLRVNGHGFTLARYKLRLAFSSINLNLSEIIDEHHLGNPSTMSISSSILHSYAMEQVTNELSIIDVRPAQITLIFDSLATKRVVVAPNADIQFRPRFDFSREIEMIPAEIQITGPRALLAMTDTVFTHPKQFRNTNASFERAMTLDLPPRITAAEKRVVMKVSVDEYTENGFSVPIRVVDAPENSRIRLFPREVEVRFIVGLQHFADIKPENIDLYITFEEISDGRPTLKVQTGELPAGIKSLQINPTHVEYLIETN